jgi:hypothetical protein
LLAFKEPMAATAPFVRNILTCHACPHRQLRCMGSCACLKDGRDIIEHARMHDCPDERYRSRGVGDSVAWVFRRLGMHRLFHLYRDQTAWQRRPNEESSNAGGCGCDKRRAALNTWVRYS